MDASKLSSLSNADTDEKIGEFWDTHDFTEFDTDVPDIEFEIVYNVPIEIKLFSEIEKQARKRGVKVETLINLWLRVVMRKAPEFHSGDISEWMNLFIPEIFIATISYNVIQSQHDSTGVQVKR